MADMGTLGGLKKRLGADVFVVRDFLAMSLLYPPTGSSGLARLGPHRDRTWNGDFEQNCSSKIVLPAQLFHFGNRLVNALPQIVPREVVAENPSCGACGWRSLGGQRQGLLPPAHSGDTSDSSWLTERQGSRSVDANPGWRLLRSPPRSGTIAGRRNIGLRPQICLCANMQFLHRTADPGGLDAFTTALQRGVSNEQVALILMGSAEYFARV